MPRKRSRRCRGLRNGSRRRCGCGFRRSGKRSLSSRCALENLKAAHFGLDTVLNLIAGSSLPEASTKVTRGPKDVVPGYGCRSVLLLGSFVLADRNERRGLALDDRGIPTSRFVCAVHGQGADRLFLGDLLEQFRQKRAVAGTIGCELFGADIGGSRFHGQLDLPTLVAALRSMLACCHSPPSKNSIPLRSMSRLSIASVRRSGIWRAKVFCFNCSLITDLQGPEDNFVSLVAGPTSRKNAIRWRGFPLTIRPIHFQLADNLPRVHLAEGRGLPIEPASAHAPTFVSARKQYAYPICVCFS